MLFWFLCNDLDEDEEGWIHISRQELSSLYRQKGGCKITNISAILLMLHTEGYIYLESIKTKPTNYAGFSIRICDEAWEPRVVKNKVYRCSTTRSERRQRQKEQQLHQQSNPD